MPVGRSLHATIAIWSENLSISRGGAIFFRLPHLSKHVAFMKAHYGIYFIEFLRARCISSKMRSFDSLDSAGYDGTIFVCGNSVYSFLGSVSR